MLYAYSSKSLCCGRSFTTTLIVVFVHDIFLPFAICHLVSFSFSFFGLYGGPWLTPRFCIHPHYRSSENIGVSQLFLMITSNRKSALWVAITIHIPGMRTKYFKDYITEFNLFHAVYNVSSQVQMKTITDSLHYLIE